MTTWKLDSVSKAILLDLASKSSNEEKIKKIADKEVVNLEDLTLIKKSVPSDVPVFAFFNKLTVHVENTDYKASSAFRKKTEKLRMRQEDDKYKKLVQSVDSTQKYGQVNHMENFGAELRSVNRQLISVVNVVITVVGSFFFGFSGVTYAYPHLKLDLATRFLIGLVLGTIVFFADLYFILKSMEFETPDDMKKPYENSHNLNFKEVRKAAVEEMTEDVRHGKLQTSSKPLKTKKNE